MFAIQYSDTTHGNKVQNDFYENQGHNIIDLNANDKPKTKCPLIKFKGKNRHKEFNFCIF